MFRTSGAMLLVTVGSLAALSGCQGGEDAAMEAERDLTEARREGARDVEHARQEARQDVHEARQGAAEALQGARREATEDVAHAEEQASKAVNLARAEAGEAIGAARQQAEEARRDALAPAPGIADRIAERLAAVVQTSGLGGIRGRVLLSGAEAPVRAPLERTAGCDGMSATDENVVVNSDRTLRNVIVRLVGDVPGPADAATGTLAVGQDHCMFNPRVSAIVAGQTIEVERVGGVLKVPTVFAHGPFTRGQIGSNPAESQISPSGGLLTFRDPARPWMRAYVMVLNHDHFAVTDGSGAFTLPNVPPGTYSVESWQEQLGRKSARVTVRPDQVADVDFTYSGTETGGFATARTRR